MKEEDLERLGYSKIWLEYQLMTQDQLENQIIEFEKGEDPYTEHFRYSTFRKFYASINKFDDTLLTRLFEIIKVDNDIGMAAAMAMDILRHKALSDNHYELVSVFLKETFGEYMQRYIDRQSMFRKKIKD